MKTLLKKLVYLSQINRVLTKIIEPAIVLGYHRVVPVDDSLMVRRIGAVTEEELAFHLGYLRALGFGYVTLQEALSEHFGAVCAITFDDGFKDLYENAFPILKAHGAPFTLFLVTSTLQVDHLLWQHRLYSLIDGLPTRERVPRLLEAFAAARLPEMEVPTASVSSLLTFLMHTAPKTALLSALSFLDTDPRRALLDEASLAQKLYLTREELSTMIASGLEIGAHGHEHWNMRRLEPNERAEEVFRSLETIENHWGIRPTAYAVAHGSCDTAVRDTLIEHGVQILAAGRGGLVDDPANCLDVPRVWPTGSDAIFAWTITRLLVSQASRRLRSWRR